MATIIYPSGIKTAVEPKNPKEGFSLEELYEIIETDMVEVISISKDSIMIMDEEGKLKGKDVNEEATLLAGVLPYDRIVGTVVVCKTNQFK